MNNWLRFGAFLVGISGAVVFYFTLKLESHVGYSVLAALLFIVGMLTAGRAE